jgi:hypothetical protein
MASMQKEVEKKISGGANGFVFELLGNNSVRNEQYDSTKSLPFKSFGKFNHGGKIVISPEDALRRTVCFILPVLHPTTNKPCVIVPPLLRYLFGHWCNDAGHCTDASVQDFDSSNLRISSKYVQ